MGIPENLTAAMARAGIRSANALSRLSRVPQPTISRTLSGETIPETVTLQKLAAALGTSLANLTATEQTEPAGYGYTGSLNDGSGQTDTSKGRLSSNIKPAPPARVSVPVISFLQAEQMIGRNEVAKIEEWVKWESPDHEVGSRSWAHIVEGDQMDDGTDKSIPEGWLIFVDPDIAPKAGHFVIAKDASTQAVTFKKLTFDGGRWYLQPLNRQYQAIEIDNPELRVIGVVTEARPPSRKLV